MGRTRRKQSALYNPRRRHDSRTRLLFDETGQDNGMFYECWHCGFTCNDKRDTLGDGSSRDGVTHGDFGELADPEPGPYGSSDNSVLEQGGLASASLVIKGIYQTKTINLSDSDGNPVEPKHLHSISGSGCPFCHSQNWRGDY